MHEHHKLEFPIERTTQNMRPMPSGDRTLEIYGNVIRGKMNDEIVSKAFIIKFFLIEGWFTFIFSFDFVKI